MNAQPVLTNAPGPFVSTSDGREFLYFGGSSYLGLNTDPAVISALSSSLGTLGFGTGASRATSGECESYLALEKDICELTSAPVCVVVPSTLLAPLILLDLHKTTTQHVLVDESAHPALHSAIKVSGLPFSHYRRHDTIHARKILRKIRSTKSKVLLCTDGVNATNGSVAPLDALWSLAQSYDASLMVDDSHGFGILGNGLGSAAGFGINHRQIDYIASFSKAFGSIGGFFTTPFFHSQQARHSVHFTTSTPFPALVAQGIRAALAVGIRNPAKRQYLHSLTAYCRDRLKALGISLMETDMPVFAFSLGCEHQDNLLLDLLKNNGLWIPAIRYPTGDSPMVFRMTLTANHTRQQIDRCLSVMEVFMRSSSFNRR